MILYVLAVRDRAADVFGRPFFSTSTGAAIRDFGDQINNNRDDSNTLHRHPGDFDLYILGQYDDSNGSFETHAPKQVAIGKDLVVTKEK